MAQTPECYHTSFLQRPRYEFTVVSPYQTQSCCKSTPFLRIIDHIWPCMPAGQQLCVTDTAVACDLMQKEFRAFRDEVLSPDNQGKLFVMVVDEAHHAAVRRGAHDAFVNDLMWKGSPNGQPKHGAWPSRTSTESATEVPGKLCQAQNFVTLLVSATPACLLTGNSRLPRAYFLPKAPTMLRAQELGLKQYSIIKSSNQNPDRPVKLGSMLWKCGQTDIPAGDLRQLISAKVGFAVTAARIIAVTHTTFLS